MSETVTRAAMIAGDTRTSRTDRPMSIASMRDRIWVAAERATDIARYADDPAAESPIASLLKPTMMCIERRMACARGVSADAACARTGAPRAARAKIGEKGNASLIATVPLIVAPLLATKVAATPASVLVVAVALCIANCRRERPRGGCLSVDVRRRRGRSDRTAVTRRPGDVDAPNRRAEAIDDSHDERRIQRRGHISRLMGARYHDEAPRLFPPGKVSEQAARRTAPTATAAARTTAKRNSMRIF